MTCEIDKEAAIRTFLKDPVRQKLISTNAIEDAANLPATTLAKFLSGKRSLPSHHVSSLANVLVNIGFPANFRVISSSMTEEPALITNQLPLFTEEHQIEA